MENDSSRSCPTNISVPKTTCDRLRHKPVILPGKSLDKQIFFLQKQISFFNNVRHCREAMKTLHVQVNNYEAIYETI